MLRKMTLRSKLLLALVLPLIALIALTTLRVQSRLDDAAAAQTELTEVDRAVALNQLALAIRDERDAIASLTTTEDDVLAAQAALDQKFDEVVDEELHSFADSELEAVNEIRSFVVQLRAAIPTDPAAIRLAVATDLAEGRQLTDQGSAVWAFTNYGPQVSRALDLGTFDPTLIVDGSEAANLTTLQLIGRVSEAIRNETLFYIQVSQLPAEQITPAALGLIREQYASSRTFEASLRGIGSRQWQSRIDEFFATDAYGELEAKRNAVQLFEAGVPIDVDPISVAQLRGTVLPPLDQLQLDILNETRDASIAAEDVANRNAVLTLSLIAGIGAALALLVFALYRSIRKPIRRLTKRANEIADTELPEAVALMRSDDAELTRAEINPIAADANDEVGDLVHAFNGMHATALDLATQQAASRRIVGDMFVNLGRRNQKLLLRILKTLDGLEQEESDPQRLAELYKVDHLATRMRRNAESLLVLAGAQTSRRFSRSVAMGDVVRAALTEVENYERVDVSISDKVEVIPEAVADLGHLLAELIENALTFSPQDRNVNVLARDSRNGYLIAVIDQGFGLSQDDLTEYNQRITEAARLEETPSKFLGLHVVGRLAARHGIAVELMEGVTSGVTARVRVPEHLLATPTVEQNGTPEPGSVSAATPSVATPGSTAPAATAPTVEHQPTTSIAAPTATETVDSGRRVDDDPFAGQQRRRTTVVGSEPTSAARAPSADAGAESSGHLPRRRAEDWPDGLKAPTITDEVNSDAAMASEAAAASFPAMGSPGSESATLFGSAKRTPGQNLPAGVSGVPTNAPATSAPAAATPTPVSTAPVEDRARAFGSNLSGFQQAVKKADRDPAPGSPTKESEG